MKAINTEEWNTVKERNSKDPYSACTVRYAEAWADLMEQRLPDTTTGSGEIGAIAKQASIDADTEGITGFMYGCAVGMLAQHWVHGEALRRWHNLSTQIRSEGARANETGGVLNPALMTISGADAGTIGEMLTKTEGTVGEMLKRSLE
jgi:hypothetical protein